MTCLAAHRLLVPLLEVDGDLLEGDDSDPCAGSDRAVAAVSMRDPDGRPLGLAFTGMAPLVAWDASARPLPVEASRAAGAILTEGGRALLVDAGSPHALRIEGLALARLASGERWPEPWADPAVREAVIGELGPVLASGEVQVRLAGPEVVEPAPGPDGDQVPPDARPASCSRCGSRARCRPIRPSSARRSSPPACPSRQHCGRSSTGSWRSRSSPEGDRSSPQRARVR